MAKAKLTLTVPEVEEAIGIPFEGWAARCHEISLAIVKSDLIAGPRRVARGFAKGVRSQHSWVVIGDDCYDLSARIIDPTLWSYDKAVEGIWHGSLRQKLHFPHGGDGTIWQVGRPPEPVEKIIELVGYDDLSWPAKHFLQECGPLDRRGWSFLAHAPVRGWPAGEIIALMSAMPALGALVPIDIVGMVTDLNPKGLYLPEAA